MLSRIYGLEHEYGLIFSGRGSSTVSVESALGYLFDGLATRQSGSNVFLPNGGRLYQDTGCHPEYATPECRNPRELVAHDKAGERIMEQLMLRAEKELARRGLRGNLFVFKNNTDSVGNTYGCHENYLVDRRCEFHRLSERLIPFLVTRQVFTGAGKILRAPAGYRYVISQRAQHICQRIASVTTNSRSIVNTRDEPHADPEKYRRLHLIVSDSNMSELSEYLKVATTGIVLTLLEEDARVRDLQLQEPVHALREVSNDLTCRKLLRLANGKMMTAVQIQKVYVELAVAFFSRTGADEETAHALRTWADVLESLEDPRSLNGQVDWVTKKVLLDAYTERSGLQLADPRVAMIDLQYHDIRRDRGLYYLLERRGHVARVASDEQIERAMEDPPEDTRALLRGKFVRAAERARRSYTVDWSYVRLNDRFGSTVICKNPFASQDSRIEFLLSSI
jgi:proteasome accessory factor A